MKATAWRISGEKAQRKCAAAKQYSDIEKWRNIA